MTPEFFRGLTKERRRVKVDLVAIPDGDGEDFREFCKWLQAAPTKPEGGRAYWPRIADDFGDATHVLLWTGEPVALWYPSDTVEADRLEAIEEKHARADLDRRNDLADARADLDRN